MTEKTRLRMGVAGLGSMGAPMAANLAKSGFLHAVWNRTRERAQRVARDTGARQADDLAQLAGECDAVLTCVSADGDLREVVAAMLPALRADSIVIDTSTVGVETAQGLAHELAAQGAYFLDAPVSGGVEGARNGRLVMMVGGDAPALARVKPALDTVAARIEHVGPVGSGQAAKAVNQIMAAGINQAVTEALALGEAAGLPMDKVVSLLGEGAAASWFLAHRGAAMLRGEYPPGFKLRLHHKDLVLCKALAQRHGVQLPVVEMSLVHYRRLMAAGHGEEDISALFRHKRRLFEEARTTMNAIKVERQPDSARLRELQVERWPVWTKEMSTFPWTYDDTETCYLLEGDVVVTPAGGAPVRFGKGDLVTFAKGLSCTWEVRAPVRKHYKFG